MTKKEYIIYILKELQDSWGLAKGFLILLEKIDDDKLIDKLFVIFRESIKNLNSLKTKKQILSANKEIKYNKKIEKSGVLNELKEIEKLLSNQI